MEFRKIVNAEGEVLTTKEGVELEELRFEVGDEFVPIFNSVLERTHEATVQGRTKNITNYSIKCRARNKNKEIIKHKNEEDIFVALTPGQAQSLNKKVEEGLELNQNLFIAYRYKSKDYGTQIGLGLKNANKPAKTFADFDKIKPESLTKESEKNDMHKKPSEMASQIKEKPIKIEDIE